MNKLVIPALLLGVVMVAGAFAFVPVGQAATVHDTLLTEAQDLGDAFCDWSDDTTANDSQTADLVTGLCFD